MMLRALLLTVALGAPAPPTVSAVTSCQAHDVTVSTSYTAGVHDEFITVVATLDGARTTLGRDVFVRHGQTFSARADLQAHEAPDGVRVRWSGFSTERSIPWAVVWRTPSVAC